MLTGAACPAGVEHAEAAGPARPCGAPGGSHRVPSAVKLATTQGAGSGPAGRRAALEGGQVASASGSASAGSGSTSAGSESSGSSAQAARRRLGQARLEPDDPKFNASWHLPRVQAPQAWALATGSAAVRWRSRREGPLQGGLAPLGRPSHSLLPPSCFRACRLAWLPCPCGSHPCGHGCGVQTPPAPAGRRPATHYFRHAEAMPGMGRSAGQGVHCGHRRQDGPRRSQGQPGEGLEQARSPASLRRGLAAPACACLCGQGGAPGCRPCPQQALVLRPPVVPCPCCTLSYLAPVVPCSCVVAPVVQCPGGCRPAAACPCPVPDRKLRCAALWSPAGGAPAPASGPTTS